MQLMLGNSEELHKEEEEEALEKRNAKLESSLLKQLKHSKYA